MNRFCTLFCWLLMGMAAQAQVLQDNFNDGNFTANPAWQGSTANFTVNGSNELQLNIPGVAATSQLVVPAAIQDSTQWEFYVRLSLSPSTTNVTRIYLQSDNADLTASLNGYYLLIGEAGTTDALKIFRQTATTSTLVAAGTAGLVATNPNVRVRITRTNAGVWTIEADYAGGTNFVADGTGTDNTYPSGSFFGIRVTNTTTNGTNYVFDDIRVSPLFVDVTPPALVSATALSATQVDVLFSEAVTAATAQNIANYLIDNGISVSTATIDGSNPALVHLTVSSLTSGTTYQLTTSNIQDATGNTLTTANTNFTYYNIQTPVFGDILINEIMADPSPVVGLPNAEYIELFNRSNKVFNLANYVLNDGTAQTLPTHIFLPNTQVILCANANAALFSSYGTVLSLPSLTLTNGGELLQLFDNNGTLIDSLTFALSWYQDAVKDDGGWSLELINPNLTCNGASNWIASVAAAGGTPGTVNSVFNNTPDTQAPAAISASFTSATTVSIVLNENITNITATNAANYTIAGFTVLSAVQTSPNTVLLTLDAPMTSTVTYTVNMQNLADCTGNAAPTSAQFTYYDVQPAAAGDILIHEIMADPSPVVGLPDAEYIELHNISNKTINLADFEFNDGAAHLLPSFILPPGAYVILCGTSFVAAFQPYGDVLDIGTLSLTNGGELLQLLDNNGSLIDSVTYALSWYRDAAKDDGGWSLELINPNLTCNGASNWIASVAAAGGTPGAVNSVFNNTPDTQAPAAVSASFTSATTVSIVLNENITTITATNAANYSIAGFTVLSAVQTSPNTVLLTLDAPMTSTVTYTVNMQNLADCTGNAAPTSAQFTYYDVQAAAVGDIIINEIFADPSPVVHLPEAEYVELHNISNKTINLADFEFNDGSAHTLPSHILTPGAYVILCGTSFVSAFQPYGDVLDIGSLSLTNGGELLQLLDNNGTLIDAVDYDLSWYRDAAKDDGGWSLELVNPALACTGAANWTAAVDTMGGTPGAVNSVFDNTPDTQAPAVISTSFLSSTQVVLVFNEVLDAASAANAANYTLAGFTVTAAVFHAPDTVILTLDAPLQAEVNYTLNIQNVADCTGNPATIGVPLLFYNIQPAAYGDLLIYEIFADPTPVVGLPDAEYIELYNISTKTLDLADYVLNDGSDLALPSYVLRPDSFVIVCLSTQVASFQTITNNVIGVSGLALTNAGELLSLYNSNSELLDSVTYSDDWYQSASKDDGGWSLEMINPMHKCQGASNWRASSHPLGGTPGRQNAEYDPTVDSQSPDVVEIRQYAADQVYIRFNETMGFASLANTANYSINNGLTIIGVNVLNLWSVVLTVNTAMTSGTTYEVTLNGVADCIGNAMNRTASFLYYEYQTAEHYDIIINEIFPDYNPVVGLPEIEYVELYNRSNNVINLQDFTFSDGSSTLATLPFYNLAPSSYVVLYKDNGTAGYTAFGAVLPLAVFPDMDVSGDDLVLRDGAGTVIDAVSYDPTWYGNSDKSTGGWSLERINPNAPCAGSSNWMASLNPIGGTPAQANSVLQTTPDSQLPDVWSAYPFAADSIRLFFSEAMGDLTALNTANYIIDNNLIVVEAYLEPPFYNTIVILTDNPLVPGVVYTLTLQSGLTDCVGNEMSANRSVQFALPAVIEAGDILINEVLFNPISGGRDFVELYNHSNKVLNIGDLILANTDENGNIDQTERVAIDWLLFPQQYVVITEEPSQVKLTYISENPLNYIESDLPSYADDTGNVIIYITLDTNAVMIDRFDYSENYHTPLLDDENGVSLERIDFDAPTNDRNNWHSAATEVGYATPTYQNSSFRINEIGDDGIIQLPDNVFSPDGDGYEDFLLINYNVDDLGYVANLHIYDAQGHLVRQLVNGQLLMTEGTLQWDGAMDNGKKAPRGMYVLAIEIYNPEGTVKRYKKTCVVAHL